MKAPEASEKTLPAISAVVVSYNSAAFLPACLRSILSQDYPRFDVTVVDNASWDGSVDLVAKEFPAVRVMRSAENRGYAGGANLGLRQTSGDILVLLNPDVELRPDCLLQLAAPLQADAKAGAVGCKIFYPDNQTLQHAGGEPRFPLALAWHRGYGEIDQGQYDKLGELDYVTGAVLAIRRSVLEELDYFDERFNPVYFEDTDFCFRVRQAGYKIIYAPGAVATHHESSTVEQQSHTYFRYFHRSRLRFVTKHYRLEDLLRAFYPAEAQRLAGPLRPLDWQGSMEVYRAGVAQLARKVGITSGLEEGATGMDARQDVTGQDETGRWQAVRQQIQEVDNRWLVRERPFTSSMPGLGKMIVYLRDRLNRVSTKWYIQPILQQQVQYNSAVSRALGELSRQTEDLDAEMQRQVRRVDSSVTVYTAVVGERLALLEEKLDRRFGQIEDKLARLEGLLDAKPKPVRKKPAGSETGGREVENG